jgi:hypothetical protein
MAFQPNYMGITDAEQIAWLLTFAAALLAAPANYQVDPADAAAMDVLTAAASASFAIGGTTGRHANDPATYTPVTSAAFAADLASAKGMAAPLAMQIRQNLGVTDGDKIAAGIRPLNNTRAAVPVPTTIPILNVLFAAPGTHTLEFADSDTPSRKIKPFGATAMQLFAAVLPAATFDPTDAAYLLSASKNPVFAAFLPADNGKVASYFGRWITRKGLEGPWSAPVAFTIAF